MSIPLRKQFKSALGLAAGAAGLYGPNFRSKMLVMAFHRVNDHLPEDGLTCSSEKFRRFCLFFRRHFQVTSLAEQASGCAAGKDMSGTLSITFDDGYRDNCEVAAPILRELSLPATFFVTTGFVNSQAIPFWDRELPVQPGWMTWDQVRSLTGQGFDIGCHTDTHIDMGVASTLTIRRELEISKSKLRSELGRETRLFAYPFGGPENICDRSLALVREAGFDCCVSCYGGVNFSPVDPFRLNRVAIAEWYSTPHQFGFELMRGRV